MVKKKDKILLGGIEGAKLRLLRAREKEKIQERELRERESGKIKLPQSKYEKEQEKKRKELLKKVGKVLKKKVTSRRILNKGQMSVKIPEYNAPSVLGDTNRFFKNEWEETKRSMFI